MSAAALATIGAGFLNTAGTVYSNTLNSAAQLAANKQNAAVQYAINADQIEAARMNNETAINLANTAHQREVRDLRDANLNPILSANGNGSAVPSLDTPGLESPQAVAPTVTNPLEGVASGLASAVQVSDQHDLNQARLLSLGVLGADKQDLKYLSKLYFDNACQSVASATDEARAEREEAETRQVRAELENLILSEFAGGRRSDSVRIPDPRVLDLVREGLLSDLKYRSNRNFREGLNSATKIADTVIRGAEAASDFVNPVKRKVRR